MSERRTVVIAGGSGYLGLNLARHLAAGQYDVVILSRSPPTGERSWHHVPWDGRTIGEWASALDGAAAIVNLAGRSVDCIKSPARCDEILRSRIEPTRILGEAARAARRPPPVWVQMSTAHIYGDPPDARCDESSALGYGLAPTVGQEWEAACRQSAPKKTRTVFLRTSFVLGRTGGALPRLAKLARWGLGGRVGRGDQGISWIHERDMNRLLQWAIEESSAEGVYVATAPNPVSHAEFMRALRRVLRRPIGLPAPAWLVRVGAPLIMRTDPELALYGRYCVPTRLLASGFTFEFSKVAAALEDLYR